MNGGGGRACKVFGQGSTWNPTGVWVAKRADSPGAFYRVSAAAKGKETRTPPGTILPQHNY